MLAQQLARPQQALLDQQRHGIGSKHAYSITGTQMRLISYRKLKILLNQINLKCHSD
jgi:hypothetical protein